MSNVPPPDGPSGPPGIPNGVPPVPGGVPPLPAVAPGAPETYAYTTRTPVAFLPVVLRGMHIGYLWAGTDGRSAGFLRRSEFVREAFDSPFVWNERLRESYAQGVPGREAIRQWIGRPEHPEGGGVPAGAREDFVEGTRALYRLADPDAEESPADSLFHGEFPDGTPLDRSEGWGPLHVELPPGYDLTTDGPVRYLPVVRDGLVLGYLWAGVTGNAAWLLRRDDAGAPAGDAMNVWVPRLRGLHAQNVPASEVLTRCRAMPADPAAGAVPADAQQQQAPTLEALRARASRYEQSMRIAENPQPHALEVLKRPAPDPTERQAALRYLRQAPIAYDTGRTIPDEFDPAHPASVPHTYHTDGTWIWRGGVAHHLEHHGVAPEPDLLQHIRSNAFRLPPMSTDVREQAKRTLRLHRILVPPPL